MFGFFKSPKDSFYEQLKRATYEAAILVDKKDITGKEKNVLYSIIATGGLFPTIYSQPLDLGDGKLLISDADFECTRDKKPGALLPIFCVYCLFNLIEVSKNDKVFGARFNKILPGVKTVLSEVTDLEPKGIDTLLDQLEEREGEDGIGAVYPLMYAQPLELIFGSDRAKSILLELSKNPLGSTGISLAIPSMFIDFIKGVKTELAE